MPTMRYREALNQALREEMEADENVFIMGEDIGVFQGPFKVRAGVVEEFGEKRVRDTPISENTIVGMGVGSAMIGLRPVVELMTINFSLLAMDQIVNHAAAIRYMFGGQVKVPMVIRMPQGAGHQLGPTHAAPARPRHDPRIGREDQPRRDRRGGLAPRRRRRQPRGADSGAGLRLA